MLEQLRPTRALLAATLVLLGAPSAGGQAPALTAVARNLVQSAMVTEGDKVLITGSVRDAPLMEHIAIETMKVGGRPVLSLWSEALTRRSYDEVPAKFDAQVPTENLALIKDFDVQIALDVGESEGLLANVPTERKAARAKAAEPVSKAFFDRKVRLVNLGNGLYPTATLSRRLGVARPALASAFWKASSVPPQTLRERGEALRSAFAQGRDVKLTHPNGTNLTFRLDVDRGFVSDGAITPEKVKQGAAAANTWLPAGELILPAANGTAEGKVVIDKTLWDGKVVRGLTLTYSRGRLTSMTAASNFEGMKAAYDAAGGDKDRFAYIDIGINPETKLPVGTGRTVWTAPGSVAVGLGDNRGFGGTNVSDFGMANQLGGATVTVDGKVVVDKGKLK
jgi:leucyl aminopeptidase (aminopeptidase T)